MTAQRYSLPIIVLHWLMALMVIAIIAIPYLGEATINQLGGPGVVFTWHKSLGVCVLVLTVLRLIMRATTATPPTAGDTSGQRFMAKAGHALLYVLLLGMPLSGLIFGSRPVNFFWLFEIAPLGFDTPIRDAAKAFHKTAQYALMLLILGHVAMALFHHYVRKDGLLNRMKP